MAYDSSLSDRVTDMLVDRRALFETKAMMGGLCFMVHDKMCLGVADTRLMVRLDPAVEGVSLQRPGCKPMDFTGRPMKGYVFVHPEGYKSDAQLRHWVELALAFNPKAKPSKKRKPSNRTS
jgi:TfoX/Sxy family transcriptional regulator of competence genes